MEPTRELRRMTGLLAARLPELRLDQVGDTRDRRGRRWKLAPLITTALVAQLAGARSTADAEELTRLMSSTMRRRLGIARRVPDTTLRDTLCGVAPDDVRAMLHRQVHAAHRRKALAPHELPFGVVAMDGKSSTLSSWDADFVQRHVEGDRAHGLLRTLTSCLVSARAAPCLDAFAVPAATNEAGAFAAAFAELVRVHGHLFRLITYDAGAASGKNAAVVVAAGKDYLFALKQDQPKKLEIAQRVLAGRAELARSETILDNRRSVVRSVRLAPVSVFLTHSKEPMYWPSTRTIVEVTAVMIVDGEIARRETRYFLSSLSCDALSPAHWLLVVRRHWGVENDCHKTFDVAFDEDDHPWIEMNPRGALVVLLLRRIAYNLLALFRAVTQRSAERRAMPWKRLMRWVERTLLDTRDEHVADLRIRRPVAAFR